MRSAIQNRLLTMVGTVVAVLGVTDSIAVFCGAPMWMGIVLTTGLGVAVLVLIGASAAYRLEARP